MKSTRASARSGRVRPRASRPAHPDFAARLASRLRTLRTRIEGRDALLLALREANATLDPAQVAGWLVRQFAEWIPALCWAVMAHDMDGRPAVIAAEGFTADADAPLRAVTAWVLRHGTEFASADLARDGRVTSDAFGSAVGLPLVCRNATVGALIGFDEVPSARVPTLGPTVAPLVRAWLEPTAIAFDNALALQKAEALSVTDDLTRLYNSRFLNIVLRRETKRALRGGRPLSLLFIDLDGFKTVNDRFGHQAGGSALIEAATVIRGSARETDVVARFGGDEFSVILPETGRDGAESVAVRIRDRFRAFRFLNAEGLSVSLTASIGVATLPDVAASAEELLRAADLAMYRAKAAGKDGIHVAQEAPPSS